ncbi:MAG: CbtB domain-containing protein [Dehalococcoidia bacterium]
MTDHADSYGEDRLLHPPPISLGELAPWASFAGVLLMLVALVAVADGSYVHELFHDGRHLLALPCH